MFLRLKRCRNRGRNEWTKLPGRIRAWRINQSCATPAFTRPEKYWISSRSDFCLFTYDNSCSGQHKQTLNELHIEIDRLKLQNKDQQWKLVMAGCGPERVRADFSAQTTDLGQAVSFLKHLNYTEFIKGSGLSNKGAWRGEFGLEEQSRESTQGKR